MMFDLSGEALEAAQVKEKLMNNVMWDKATVDKLVKEIPKAKLITPATVSERLKVTEQRTAETSESVGWQNFGRMLLVFGCIGSDFCNKICVLQHFSKSTRFSS